MVPREILYVAAGSGDGADGTQETFTFQQQLMIKAEAQQTCHSLHKENVPLEASLPEFDGQQMHRARMLGC